MSMASSEIEESSKINNELRRPTSRLQSPSTSMPIYSRDPCISHSGPLRGERQTPLVQMSGPLYISRPSDRFEIPLLEGQGRTSSTINIKNYSSSNVTNKVTWLDDGLAEKNGRLLKSGQLGMCNDPYCTTCPTYYKLKPAQSTSRSEANGILSLYQKLNNFFAGDAKSRMRRPFSFMGSCVPHIMNPHAKFVQIWNKFVVISCLVAIFVDPLFFFLLSVEKEKKCITLDWSMATVVMVMRSTTDFIYFCHMLLQFRVAFVAPESTVVGAGELVDQPKDIALHYLCGYFPFDVLVVLPLPQILLFAVPTYLSQSPTNSERKLLRGIVLLQYIPRFYKFLYLLAGLSTSGFVFNIILNFFICALAGHVVGSYWYLFGLQRVNQCLRNACAASSFKDCKRLLNCGRGDYIQEFNLSEWNNWLNDSLSTDCIEKKGTFSYGIYAQAVELSTTHDFITRYVYSFFWGFQQITTLAGNQIPSYFVGEVLFTICIVALGSFLFALLVGNMLNFLQALMRGRLERQLKHHNVEQWMRHRRLPEVLKRQVRQSEAFYWAATRGVNEEILVENLPEDLQREIRRHLFSFIKKVRMFEQMEDPIFDAICGRLRQKLYIVGSKILYDGGIGDKMFFIVRGKMISDDGDGNEAQLSEGDFCGEELLSWCLDHYVVKKDGRKMRATGQQFLSNRTVTCLTNVETFSLQARDLEEVAILFPKFLRHVQNAIRRDSPYWRGFAATCIQVAWRYRKKWLSRQKLIATHPVVNSGFRSWAKKARGG